MKENFERFSPGLVLQSYPGLTAFPVAAAIRLFDISIDLLSKAGITAPISLWDPCCGSGYTATVLGFLRAASIREIFLSDVDLQVLNLAKQNIALLSEQGLKERITILEDRCRSFHKDSHRKALKYAHELIPLTEQSSRIVTKCFSLDLLNLSSAPQQTNNANIIFIDPPYGRKSYWQGTSDDNPLMTMFQNLHTVARLDAIIAVASVERAAPLPPHFMKIKTVKAGVRRIHLFQRKRA